MIGKRSPDFKSTSFVSQNVAARARIGHWHGNCKGKINRLRAENDRRTTGFHIRKGIASCSSRKWVLLPRHCWDWPFASFPFPRRPCATSAYRRGWLRLPHRKINLNRRRGAVRRARGPSGRILTPDRNKCQHCNDAGGNPERRSRRWRSSKSIWPAGSANVARLIFVGNRRMRCSTLDSDEFCPECGVQPADFNVEFAQNFGRGV